jgi:hypothetical protein
VDAIPGRRSGKVPARIAPPVASIERIDPRVDRKKVITDCGIDCGVESYQTVDGEFAAAFLKPLNLSTSSRLRLAQLCPACHQVMPLASICDRCG